MKKLRYLLFPLCMSLVASFVTPSLYADDVTIRPIEDFLDRQGKYCLDVNFAGSYEDQIVDGNFVGNCSTGAPPLLFVPPIANFLGSSDPGTARSSSVDYAGLADYWAGGAFGTTFSGTVIERDLADGRAWVEVSLNTDKALTWVVDGFDFDGPLLFGSRAPEAAAGADSALGSSHYAVTFINTATGADLPDLIQLAFFPEAGQELVSLKNNNQARGPLTANFGVPEGTPGRTHTVQVGLFGNPQCGVDSPSAVADCFPAEKIFLQITGK